MRFWQVIRDDWRMRVAVILVLLMTVLYIFNLVSNLPKHNPIIGVFTYALVPALFVAGALNFILVILKAKGKVTKRKLEKLER